MIELVVCCYNIECSTHSRHEVEVCGDVAVWGSNRRTGKKVSVFEVRISEILSAVRPP